MGFLPVSQRLHISVSALPEREIKTGVLKMLPLYWCILKDGVTLLMALFFFSFFFFNTVREALMLRKYFGLI